jgi:MYXO-CTERM domain-containing protein
MSRRPIASLFVVATSLAALTGSVVAQADTTVQIPLTGVLDARSVTTLTNGQLVVFTLPTDGGNLQNAFATKAVAMMQGKPVENALPDDGKFPADARHPEVVLNFSNAADAASPQTHLIKTGDMMMFPVPPATYSKLFLFFNGAAGGTLVTVTLNYADGMEMKTAMIPDYYADVAPTDPVIFTLAGNLAKWTKTTTINEANHHNITGAELAPMPGKMLNSVQVSKDAMGNLVFWGATGIATSPVAVGGAGGGGAGGAAGAAGVAGAAGSGGAGGTSSGGTAGSAGAVGAGGITSPSAGAAGAGVSAGATAGGSTAAGTGNGTAGTAIAAGGSSIVAPSTPASDAGCGCRVGAASSTPRNAVWLLLGAGTALRLRRKRRRPAR